MKRCLLLIAFACCITPLTGCGGSDEAEIVNTEVPTETELQSYEDEMDNDDGPGADG